MFGMGMILSMKITTDAKDSDYEMEDLASSFRDTIQRSAFDLSHFKLA